MATITTKSKEYLIDIHQNIFFDVFNVHEETLTLKFDS